MTWQDYDGLDTRHTRDILHGPSRVHVLVVKLGLRALLQFRMAGAQADGIYEMHRNRRISHGLATTGTARQLDSYRNRTPCEEIETC